MKTMTPLPDTRPAPSEPVTPLRPSEAMRLGRMLYPAVCVASLAETRPDGTVAVCAAGALAVGYGWKPNDADDSPYGDIEDRFDGYDLGPCPAGCVDDIGWYTPVHLNDHHDWPTARIADWLESLGL